jgi:bifunctional DNase/RNase
MTPVRIAHAEPRPGRQPGRGFRISSFLVVLADDAGGRALPIWLAGPEGDGLRRVLGPSDGDPPIEAVTARMLRAGDMTVTGVYIDELDAAMTSEPPRGQPDPRASARIEFAADTGAGVPHQIQARLGCALALAVACGAPVRVAGQVMDRMAVPVHGEDLLRPFLGDGAPRARKPREPGLPRFEPRNLTFADGLACWEFGGSFRDEYAHAGDYSCAAEAGRAVVRSVVEQPAGLAALSQSVLVHEYVGRTVIFRAEVRTEGVANEAGLHLLGGMPTGPVSVPEGLTVPLSGGNDWTVCEVSARVAEHGGMVQFGVFLHGPGRVWFRNLRLSFPLAASN